MNNVCCMFEEDERSKILAYLVQWCVCLWVNNNNNSICCLTIWCTTLTWAWRRINNTRYGLFCCVWGRRNALILGLHHQLCCHQKKNVTVRCHAFDVMHTSRIKMPPTDGLWARLRMWLTWCNEMVEGLREFRVAHIECLWFYVFVWLKNMPCKIVGERCFPEQRIMF